jgi:multisubunit Na+/H+ antiporter MnhG subunit
MKRIIFIVIWVFIFAFAAGIASVIIGVGLYMAGLESWSDFFEKNLLMFVICAAPITGLILGMLGKLPGTKEQKGVQASPKGEPHWTTKWIQYLILRIGLFFLFALVTFPVALIAIWVVDNYNANYESILIIPVLAYYFGLLWFSNKTAKYIAFDKHGLIRATKSAFVDLKIRLAFMPLIGNWFAPDEKGDDKSDDA